MSTKSIRKALFALLAIVLVMVIAFGVAGPQFTLFVLLQIMLCGMGLAMSGGRGFAVVLCHLLVIDFGLWLGSLDSNWQYGAIQGLALISVPAILLFWIWLIVFSQFILPILPERRAHEQAAECLLGFVTGLQYSYWIARGAKIEEPLSGKLMRKGLLPGLLLTEAHTAVPLSTGVGLSRIAGPGVTFIGRAERPHNQQVLDLRTYIRPVPVRATTQDGIDVQAVVPVVFRIEPWPPMRPPPEITPLSEAATFNALIAQRMDGSGPLKWEDIPPMLVRNIARSVIAKYMFDRLLEDELPAAPLPGEEDVPPAERRRRLTQRRLAPVPRDRIRAEIERRLRADIQERNYGIRILGVGLGDIEVAGATDEDRRKVKDEPKTEEEKKLKERVERADDVKEKILTQRIDTWRAKWLAEVIRRQAQSTAEATREIGRARAQAQMRMIQALTEGLAQARNLGMTVPTDVVVLLRLLDALEGMSLEPGTREHLSPETRHTQAVMKHAALRAAGH